ncbi:MAG: hypothetical protein ABEJ78_02635 [Haloferacaceae archaeon]
MSDVAPERSAPVRRLAEWGARRDAFPTSLRAVLGYYAATGEFDSQAVLLKRRVDETMDRLLADLYETVETALEAEFGVAEATFRYETKLTLPAELTLGYLYRQATARAGGNFDPVTGTRSRLLGLGGDTADRTPPPNLSATNREAVEYVDRAEDVTDLIVKALLDGDMRDAINDAEYEDFEVNAELERAASIRRVAEVAQETLRAETERLFDRYPDEVRAAYDRAVDVSEAHQDEDDAFRAMLRDARADEVGAREAIESAYKYAPFPDDDHPFTEAERDVPYLKTQYDRVGVIYDGMIDMYRGAGFDVPAAFEKSIVLAIVGAQIWLDDVDDFRDDYEEGQLTPVTAEYVLSSDERRAYENVVDVSETYFELAMAHATEAGSPLNGIAIEYIVRSGDPTVLPGSDG